MWRTLLLVMAAQREVFPQYHHNVDGLKSDLGIQGDDDPPKEVLDLFKEKLYNVESTMNTRDTASASRVLRRQAEAAWPQLTATDCLHVSRLYRGALRAHRCQRAPRGI